MKNWNGVAAMLGSHRFQQCLPEPRPEHAVLLQLMLAWHYPVHVFWILRRDLLHYGQIHHTISAAKLSWPMYIAYHVFIYHIYMVWHINMVSTYFTTSLFEGEGFLQTTKTSAFRNESLCVLDYKQVLRTAQELGWIRFCCDICECTIVCVTNKSDNICVSQLYLRADDRASSLLCDALALLGKGESTTYIYQETQQGHHIRPLTLFRICIRFC